jgi:putative ABC transport system permease protein
MEDVRYAFRLMRRKPGPTLVTALTMALGIGASTVLFSVTWGVLMKPLPWPDADRLLRLNETRQGSTRVLPPFLTNGTYLSWKDKPTTIEAIGAWNPRIVTAGGAGDVQRIPIASMTATVFPILRAVPAAGRLFMESDESAGNTVVLSHAYAQQRFGVGDAIGQTLQFDGRPYTVVGVMPASFYFPDRDTRAWIPFEVRPVLQGNGSTYISLSRGIARLKPGFTTAQATQEGTARGRSGPDPGMTAIAVFGSRGPVEATARPMLEAMTADVKPALLILLAAVGLLLATAAANIASVQLARATTRRREIAVRAALGAGGARLARQMLIENVVVGLLGGALGVMLAAVLNRALPSVLPADFPRVADVAIDARVLLFALGVSLLTSLAFGILPALQARKLNLVEGLVDDSASAGRGYGRSPIARLRSGIMAGQVAVACVLLIGAALLIRTFVAMLNVDRGYDSANVLTARVVLPDASFTPARRAEFVTRLLERIKARPDVVVGGVTTVLPLGGQDALMGFTMPPRGGSGDPIQAQAAIRMVSPEYMTALGLRVVQGRAFQPTDTTTSLPVVLVSRTMAKRYLQGNPIGQKLPLNLDRHIPDWEIAGVVEDVMPRSVTDPPQPEIYSCVNQMSGISSDPFVVVRTRSDPAAMTGTLRQLVSGLDSSVAIDQVMTMEQRVVGSIARPRLYAVVLGGFAAFALVIAGVGLFGVLSYGVSQRSREIGVRTALGARPSDIVRLVVGEGLVVTLIGILVGVGASLAAARSMSAFLYGVTTHDLLTFTAVPLVLLTVSALACFVPARRASRLDPLRVLKAG